jgi:hypothetical protein
LHKLDKVNGTECVDGISRKKDPKLTRAPSQLVVQASNRGCCPLAQIAVSKEFVYSRIARLPKEDFVRPTTLESTSTRIRVSHKLNVDVRYQKEGEDPVS